MIEWLFLLTIQNSDYVCTFQGNYASIYLAKRHSSFKTCIYAENYFDRRMQGKREIFLMILRCQQ